MRSFRAHQQGSLGCKTVGRLNRFKRVAPGTVKQHVVEHDAFTSPDRCEERGIGGVEPCIARRGGWTGVDQGSGCQTTQPVCVTFDAEQKCAYLPIVARLQAAGPGTFWSAEAPAIASTGPLFLYRLR